MSGSHVNVLFVRILIFNDNDNNCELMIRICTKILRFAISVPRVDLSPKEIRKNHKIDFVKAELYSFRLLDIGSRKWEHVC